MNHKEDTPDAVSKGHVHHDSSGRAVKDPVCGMYIPDTTEFRAKDAFFCSEECRRKYTKL